MNLKFVLFALGLSAIASNVSAQSSLAVVADEKNSASTSFMIMNSEDWSFYTDNESKLIYVDFEKIHVNLNEIVVTDEKSDVIFKEDVNQLPVNTIYEIDYSKYDAGKYIIELHSYTGIIKREIIVK